MAKFIWKPEIIDFGYEPGNVREIKFIHEATAINVEAKPSWIGDVSIDFTPYSGGAPAKGTIKAQVRLDQTRVQEEGFFTISASGPISGAATTEHPRWDNSLDTDIYGRDAFNFNALPAGARFSAGIEGDLGATFYLWTTDASSLASFVYLAYNSSLVQTDSIDKTFGMSIRLVRDYVVGDGEKEDGRVLSDAFLDGDGNYYNGVIIGDQVWATSNLKTTVYADLSPIPTGYTDTQWSNLTFGAYAVYDPSVVTGIADESEMIDAYGLLYNWYAVTSSSGLAINGHVPSDAEFTQLTDYLINTYGDITSDNVGDYLKSIRQVNSPYEGASETESYLIPLSFNYDSEHVPILEIIDNVLIYAGDDSFIGERDRPKAILAAKRWIQDNAGVAGTNVRFAEISVDENRVHLPGDFVELRGVYVVSSDGYLSPLYQSDNMNVGQEAMTDEESFTLLDDAGYVITAFGLTPRVDNENPYTYFGVDVGMISQLGRGQHVYQIKPGEVSGNGLYRYDRHNRIIMIDGNNIQKVVLEYFSDPILRHKLKIDVGEMKVHKRYQEALEAHIYYKIIELNRHAPMYEKQNALRVYRRAMSRASMRAIDFNALRQAIHK